jgi:hypothetical protein
MRLAASRNLDPRQQRADQLRRDRAASQSVRVAFPAIQQLRLELKFASTNSNAPGSQSHVLHPPARAFFTFPCPYANCDGHYDLTEAVTAALDDPAQRAEGMLECRGLRAQKYDSKQPCQLHLLYTVTATHPASPGAVATGDRGGRSRRPLPG